MAIKASTFSEFVASRRTTRDFLSTPVAPELIEQLITDGLTAPSWSNTRPYMVAVASGELRDQIAKDFEDRWRVAAGFRSGTLLQKIKFLVTPKAWPLSDYFMSNNYDKTLMPRARRVGKELYGLLGVARGDRKARDQQWARNYDFFGAPIVVFVFIHKSLGVFAANDAGLFAQNFMLSAHAHGLATCAQGALALWPAAVRDKFEVPKDYRMIYGIALGYPSEHIANTFRAHRIGPDEITIQPR